MIDKENAKISKTATVLVLTKILTKFLLFTVLGACFLVVIFQYKQEIIRSTQF